MTFGESCGVAALVIIACVGIGALLFYWSNRVGIR